jgi:hypothetical protein
MKKEMKGRKERRRRKEEGKLDEDERIVIYGKYDNTKIGKAEKRKERKKQEQERVKMKMRIGEERGRNSILKELRGRKESNMR